MNRLYSIFLISALSLAALSSCSQDNVIEDAEEQGTVIPSEGYIYFDSKLPQTRALVPSGPLKHSFNVLGYRYPSSWTAVKPQAKQTLRVSYTDNNGTEILASDKTKDNLVGVFGIEHTEGKDYTDEEPGVQTVSYSGGLHSYTPMQGWKKKLFYSFFAWYPTSLVANGGNSNHEGSPYITYTLPDDQASMADVLTACEIDYSMSKGKSVTLQMNHRLSALDIRANSVITAQALLDNQYTEFAGVQTTSPVTVNITGITLTLNDIYTQATIPLEHTAANGNIVTGSVPADQTYTYSNFSEGKGDVAYNVTSSVVRDSEMLILIPQSQPIQASISVAYSLSCEDKTKTGFSASKNFEISDLESGVFHYLELSFTKSGLFVKAEKAVTWEVQPDVEHTFE